MRFTPKTEAELKVVFPPGEYPAEVKSAVDAVSQKGNDMIKLGLKVFGPDGTQTSMVTDYLMEAMLGKMLHFCEATGLMDRYNAGTLNADDCMDRQVRVKLKVDRDKSGQYPDKNSVADYVVARTSGVPRNGVDQRKPNYKAPYPDPNAMAAEAAADDIPF